jgi:hypothetical protein
MTTPSEYENPTVHLDPAGTDLLPAEAREALHEVKAENAALKAAELIAEAQAEVVVEQAKQLTEMTEEVLEELREGKSVGDVS